MLILGEKFVLTLQQILLICMNILAALYVLYTFLLPLAVNPVNPPGLTNFFRSDNIDVMARTLSNFDEMFARYVNQQK